MTHRRFLAVATVATCFTITLGCTIALPPRPIQSIPATATPEPTIGPGQASPSAGAANRVPSIALFNAAPSTNLALGAAASLTIDASDPDGDPLAYSWSSTGGQLATTVGKTVTWQAPNVTGSYVVTVVVSDGKGGNVTATQTIGVGTSNASANRPPIIRYTSFPTDGQTYEFPIGSRVYHSVEVADPDNDAVDIRWTTDGGYFVGFGSDAGAVGQTNVTYQVPSTPGYYQIWVTVTDARGGKAEVKTKFSAVDRSAPGPAPVQSAPGPTPEPLPASSPTPSPPPPSPCSSPSPGESAGPC